MKVNAEPESIKLLRQVYADVCKTGEISLKTSMKVTDFLMNLSDLASVEPEPLAKNKDSGSKCVCDIPTHNFMLDDGTLCCCECEEPL